MESGNAIEDIRDKSILESIGALNVKQYRGKKSASVTKIGRLKN